MKNRSTVWFEVCLFIAMGLNFLALFGLMACGPKGFMVFFLPAWLLLAGILVRERIWDRKYGPKFLPMEDLPKVLQGIFDEDRANYGLRVDTPCDGLAGLLALMGNCSVEIIHYSDYRWTGQTMGLGTPHPAFFGCVGWTREGGAVTNGQEAMQILEWRVDEWFTDRIENPATLLDFKAESRRDADGRHYLYLFASSAQNDAVCIVGKVTRVFHVFIREMENQETVNLPAIQATDLSTLQPQTLFV